MEGLSSAAPKPSPEPFYTIRPHAGDVTSVEYLDLGTTGGLASGTGSGQLSVWRLSDKRQMWTQSCPAGITSVTRLGNTSDSLSVQLKGGVVTLWSIQTGKPGSSVTIKNPSFCRLSHFSSLVTTGQDSGGVFSSECFAVADRNYGRVNVYDCKTPKLVQTLSAENVKSRGMCMCVRAWCDGSTGIPLVLAGFDDGSLLLWDVRRPSAEMTALKLFPEPVMCLALDGEGRSGVCGSPGNSLEVFSLSTEKSVIRKKFSVELKNPGVADVAVRGDCKIMASGGWDGRIRVFGWKKGKPLAILNYHSSVVHCVSFAGRRAVSEDSNLMICGSKDSRISLWKLY